MTVTDVRTAGAIPAGWYPDPVAESGLRWWSGRTWTEYTSEPVAHAPVVAKPEPVFIAPVAVEPLVQESDAPDLSRFSRDPVLSDQPRSVSASTVQLDRRKDPYRERNLLSGIALVVAVLGLFAFVAGQLLELPDIVLYLAGGTPFSLATLAIVFAIKTGRGLAVAVIAAVLCLVNVTMVFALGATKARQDVNEALTSNPTITFELALEKSVVEATNTLEMPAFAVSADCPDVPMPSAGTVTDCTVTLQNGDSYLVHATAADGLGTMDFELVDDPISTAPAEG